MKPRTKARSFALQALYEVDITGHSGVEALEQRFADNPVNDRMQEFARKIVKGIEPIMNELDNFIAEHAPEWPIDQISTIDRMHSILGDHQFE